MLIWAVRRWWRLPVRIEAPAWRSYLAIGGFALVGLSQFLLIATGIWLDVSRSDNPVQGWLLETGALVALVALFASLLGRGPLRWQAFGLSALNIFVWIVSIPWGM